MLTNSFFPRLALLLTFLIGVGAASPALAQGQGPGGGGTVSGIIVEAGSEEPIGAATAALWQVADSSLVTGAITKEDGTFEIERVRPGEYYVRVSFVGYETKIISDVTIDRQNREAELGTIALQEATSEMEEVDVSAEREYMEVSADKTTYNVKNQPVTAGGSAQDVLENIPSVEVDVDGNISLRGSQNVAIYLNGKPAPMSGEALTSFLQSLSSDDIERVEVIPNPSARYEPEGMSGIINITLAKDRDRGWGGSVSGSAETRGRYSGSVNAHYGSGPWNLFANYSLRYGGREYGGERFLRNNDPAEGVAPLLDQVSEGDSDGLSNTLNASLDYQMSEANTLSFSSVLSYRNRTSDDLTRYLEMGTARDTTDWYARSTAGDRTDFSMDYRLTFERVIQPRTHDLSVEARYEQDVEDDADDYTERNLLTGNDNVLDRQRTDQDEREREASLQADYRRPLLSDQGHLEAGYKSEFEWLDSEFYSESWNGSETFIPDDSLNNTFDYAEQIHAVYGILGSEWGDFEAQAGLRTERALTTFDQRTLDSTYTNNYFSFFPSAHLSYKPTQENTIKFSYSKRVERPSTWQLNPFGDYDDPTFIRRGNPELDPEYTHSFELGYSRLGSSYTLSLTPYYRHTTNAISRHERTNAEGVTVLTFDNFATEDSYGAELIGSLSLGEWLKGNASVNAYKQVTDASNLSSELSNDAFGVRTRVSATAELGRGVSLQLSQFYRSPMDIPGGRIGAFTMTNLALQKELFSGKGSLSLRASDMFDTMGFEVQRDLERYYQEFSRDFNAQSLRLSFRYNFGQRDDQRRQRERQRGGDEEPEEGAGGFGGM